MSAVEKAFWTAAASLENALPPGFQAVSSVGLSDSPTDDVQHTLFHLPGEPSDAKVAFETRLQAFFCHVQFLQCGILQGEVSPPLSENEYLPQFALSHSHTGVLSSPAKKRKLEWYV
jgi:osomolarity two-component system sensor histidine kinase NIK1